MTQEQWIALGWQLAGWLLVPLAGIAAKYLLEKTQAAAADKKSALSSLLAQTAITAVTFAEQTVQANPARYQAALKYVDTYLQAHHINLPVFQIDAAIESAVLTETPHSTRRRTQRPRRTRPSRDFMAGGSFPVRV